jgi:hypothetical protein
MWREGVAGIIWGTVRTISWREKGKPRKSLSQDIRSPRRGLSAGLPEGEVRVLRAWQRCYLLAKYVFLAQMLLSHTIQINSLQIYKNMFIYIIKFNPLYMIPKSKETYSSKESRDNVVGIATGYGLDDRRVGVRVLVGSRIFSSARHPDRLWGPPSLLSNWYRGDSFPGDKATAAWSWQLTSK